MDTKDWEWDIECSETSVNGTRISCEVYTCTVYADSEEEAKVVLLKEYPNAKIISIKGKPFESGAL